MERIKSSAKSFLERVSLLIERKSKATLMRDRVKVKADLTRETKSVKDCWIDCRQLEAFEHMAWEKMKRELSR